MSAKKKYIESDIQALDGINHVRMRPSMYFDRCFKEKTLNPLIFESLCHALDEYYDKGCSNIKIDLFEDAFKVAYNSGMSLKLLKHESYTRAEAMMTRIAACSNMKKHLHVGHRYCNIGMATLNAVSFPCKLKTVSNHKKGIFVFEKGKTVSKLLIDNVEEKDHTALYFKLDPTIFKDLKFSYQKMTSELEKIKDDFKGLDFKLINHIT